MCAATLVWFRVDLRLADNPALAAAATRGARVLPVFIWAPEEEGEPVGGEFESSRHDHFFSRSLPLESMTYG